jgi:hypothetical protein
MKGSDIFPSKYIKADDLKGRDHPVTISHVAMEQLGNEQKLVLYFQGKEKGMICNKTNFGRIAYLYGDETDDWTNKPVVLTAEFVEFQGKTVKGLRIKPPASHQEKPQAPVRHSENPAPLTHSAPFGDSVADVGDTF